MTRYLLDSDALIDHLKGVASTISFIQQLNQPGNELCSCAVVECEVFTGLPATDRSDAEQLLDALAYLPATRAAGRQAGDWRGRYRAQGVQLSSTDCLIAAVAVAHGAVLVTANVRHFPMPGLTVQPLPRAQGGRQR